MKRNKMPANSTAAHTQHATTPHAHTYIHIHTSTHRVCHPAPCSPLPLGRQRNMARIRMETCQVVACCCSCCSLSTVVVVVIVVLFACYYSACCFCSSCCCLFCCCCFICIFLCNFGTSVAACSARERSVQRGGGR